MYYDKQVKRRNKNVRLKSRLYSYNKTWITNTTLLMIKMSIFNNR